MGAQPAGAAFHSHIAACAFQNGGLAVAEQVHVTADTVDFGFIRISVQGNIAAGLFGNKTAGFHGIGKTEGNITACRTQQDFLG